MAKSLVSCFFDSRCTCRFIVAGVELGHQVVYIFGDEEISLVLVAHFRHGGPVLLTSMCGNCACH